MYSALHPAGCNGTIHGPLDAIMLNSKLILLFLVPLSLSCGRTPNSNPSTPELAEQEYPFNYIDEVGQQLLYSLSTNTVSQQEVRLWINYEVLTSAEMLTIRDFNSTTYLNKYHFQQYGLISPSFVDSVEVEIEQPNITAEQLIQKLYAHNFRNLVNQPDSISSMIGDGTTYTVEIRDSLYYKAVSYNIPHEFHDSNHQAFMKIIGELENAMNWKYEKY